MVTRSRRRRGQAYSVPGSVPGSWAAAGPGTSVALEALDGAGTVAIAA